MSKTIGILTAGGDSPGLNAAIRGVGKTAIGAYDMRVVGFRDGFRGLMENRGVDLDKSQLSGILTVGGTILGTSRDKPHRMLVGGQQLDMTEVIVENYQNHHLDALVQTAVGLVDQRVEQALHDLAARGDGDSGHEGGLRHRPGDRQWWSSGAGPLKPNPLPVPPAGPG